MAQSYELLQIISGNQYVEDCYERDMKLNCFHKVHEPAERFEYEGFVIFARKTIKEPEMLRFYDNLTGIFITKQPSKDAAIEYFKKELPIEVYRQKIAEKITKYGISPAYTISISLQELSPDGKTA